MTKPPMHAPERDDELTAVVHTNAAAHPEFKLALPLIHDACGQHLRRMSQYTPEELRHG